MKSWLTFLALLLVLIVSLVFIGIQIPSLNSIRSRAAGFKKELEKAYPPLTYQVSSLIQWEDRLSIEAPSVSASGITAAEIDGDGRFYIAGHEVSQIRIVPDENAKTSVDVSALEPRPRAPPIQALHTLTRDQKDQLYVGTDRGIYQLDERRKNWIPLQDVKKNSLVENAVNALLIITDETDKQRTIFAGTRDGKIFRLAITESKGPEEWKSTDLCPDEEKMPDVCVDEIIRLLSYDKDSGNLFAGTKTRLWQSPDGLSWNKTTPDVSPEEPILPPNTKVLMVLGIEGAEQKKALKECLALDYCRVLPLQFGHPQRDRYAFFAAVAGQGVLIRMQDGTQKYLTPPDLNLSSLALSPDYASLYAGTDNGGVFRIGLDSAKVDTVYTESKKLTNAEGLIVTDSAFYVFARKPVDVFKLDQTKKNPEWARVSQPNLIVALESTSTELLAITSAEIFSNEAGIWHFDRLVEDITMSATSFVMGSGGTRYLGIKDRGVFQSERPVRGNQYTARELTEVNKWLKDQKAGQPLHIKALAFDDGRLYAGTDSGLFVIDTGENVTVQQKGKGVLPDDVRAVTFLRRHGTLKSVLAGTNEGLFWSKDGGDQWQSVPIQGIEKNQSVTIAALAGHPKLPLLLIGVQVTSNDDQGKTREDYRLYLAAYTPGYGLYQRVAVGMLGLLVSGVGLGWYRRRILLPHHIPLVSVSVPYLSAPWLATRHPKQFVETITASYSSVDAALRQTSPLAQLVLLTVEATRFTAADVQKDLEKIRAFAAEADMERALAELEGRGVLVREIRKGGRKQGEDQIHYRFSVPTFVKLARSCIPQQEKLEGDLVDRVNEGHPLYRFVVPFFQEAGLESQSGASPERLILCSDHPDFHSYGPIYTRVYTKDEIYEPDVEEVHTAAQTEYGDQMKDKLAFVVLTHRPTMEASLQIASYRLKKQEQERLTIVPLVQSAMATALRERKCHETLIREIKKYKGEVNLYIYKKAIPVTDALSFFGREKLIEELIGFLRERAHPVGIFGLRKMGKTSVMRRLRNRLIKDVAIYQTLQARMGKDCRQLFVPIIKEFTDELMLRNPDAKADGARLGLTLVCWNPDKDSLGPRNAEVDAHTASSFVHDVLILRELAQQKLGDAKFFLFLDEIEEVLPTPSGKEEWANYREFLATLRGIHEEHQFFIPIVIGADSRITTVDRWGERDNPTFNFFTEFYLPPLEEEECNLMVETIGALMGFKYEEACLKEIYRRTGGHPFLTRQLCGMVVEQVGDRSDKIAPGMIARCAQAYIESEDDTVEDIWKNRLSPEEQKVVEILVQGEEYRCTLGEFKEADTRRALRALVKRHIVREEAEERYNLAYPILGDWIREGMG